MSTKTSGTRLAMVELALYAFALWASMEMAKTPDQRVRDRLKRYQQVARCSWWMARACGRLAMEAELAYYREVHT